MPKPKTFSEAYPITCTRNELFVRQSLPTLPPELEDAVRRWCQAHDLDIDRLPVGRPIVRDPGKGTLTYWVRNKSDLEPMQIVDQGPFTAAKGTWPAPFPPVLLEQPVPSVCPTCGRDTKKPIPTEETA